jgi:hypothetical protein
MSGTGKEFPRQLNLWILFQLGMTDAVGDKFTSGEGLQDAIYRTPAMLFQTDEFDGIVRQIGLDTEGRRESIPNVLLTLYTAAAGVYPLRVKAGQKEAQYVDQPHLVLLGTATPQGFYEALTPRMLINGLTARMLIIDAGRRGKGQTPQPVSNVPRSIVDQAEWWKLYRPGSGNLQQTHPEPRTLALEPAAQEVMDTLRREGDARYDAAGGENGEAVRIAWSRVVENATKLAMLYACSADRTCLSISRQAAEWAADFATRQVRRQLWMAGEHVAESPFHAQCLRVLKRLREAGHGLPHGQLLKAMHMDTRSFHQLMDTLVQQEVVIVTFEKVAKTSRRIYQLARGV